MSSLSNVVKFADIVEGMAYSLHYSATGSKQAVYNMVDSTVLKEDGEIGEANRILNSAKYEALKIITEAREQASLIKAAAEEEIMSEMEKAKRTGFEQGFSAGKQQADKENMQMLKETGDFLNELHKKREHIVNENKDLIKKLSIDIARKIIDIDMDEDNSLFINLFKKAVNDCASGEWIKISVSSNEYDFVTSNSELLLSMVKGAKYIEAVKLDNYPKGTCIVETSSGIADASVKTQLTRIEDAFSKAETSAQYDE